MRGMKSASATAEEDLDKRVGASCGPSGNATSCGDSKNHVQIHVGVDVR